MSRGPTALVAAGTAIRRLWESMADQQDRWPLWVPVFIAVGIAAYFALPVEPPPVVFVLAVGVMIFAGTAAVRGYGRPASLLLAAALAGFALAKARTEAVRAPVLAASTGVVEVSGWVEDVRPAAQSMQRLRLKVDRIAGVRPSAWPAVLRITVRKGTETLHIGDYVSLKARLYPLEGPVEPGAYDPARQLWLEGIGGAGFSLDIPRVDASRSATGSLLVRSAIEQTRAKIGERIAAVLPPDSAGLATALISGERGSIPAETNNDLQVSGLAHILSISGLHLTLVAGSIFWLIRAGLALSPALALNYPIKKWAAAGSLVAGFAYLLISGAGVATQRSYIMLAIMGLAVLLDRPALSMRNVALAGLAILVVTPEALLTASFQMSFLAVMGLIAFYEEYARWRQDRDIARPRSFLGRSARFLALSLASIAATTLVASLLTTIPAAYHFNRVSAYGLLANVLALPVVSILVMPMALVAVLLMPLGLEGFPLLVMSRGLDAVLSIAHWVAALPGSAYVVPRMPAAAALLATAGALWICLWRGTLRLAGTVLLLAGLTAAPLNHRPDILIERTGRNVAIRNSNELLVPAQPRRARYAVGKWLLEDGDQATPAEAARRPGWSCGDKACRATVNGLSIVYVMDGAKLDAACTAADILVADFPLRGRCAAAAHRVDRFDVWRKGAHAIYLDGRAISVITALNLRGSRPWVVKPVARRSILDPATRPETKASVPADQSD
jgi:competence protein ComEC